MRHLFYLHADTLHACMEIWHNAKQTILHNVPVDCDNIKLINNINKLNVVYLVLSLTYFLSKTDVPSYI